MVDGTMGWDIFTGTGSSVNYTFIGKIAAAQATISGRLYKFDIHTSAGTVIVKVFRDDTTNYLYIGGESFVVGVGATYGIPFVSPISVNKGDMIAYYTADAGVQYAALAGGGDSKAGNITTNSLKSSWANYPYKFAIKGYIKPSSGGILFFLSEAFKNHDKLWTPKLILPKDLEFQI